MTAAIIRDSIAPINPNPDKIKNIINPISKDVLIIKTAAYFFIIPNTRKEPNITVFTESKIINGTAILII